MAIERRQLYASSNGDRWYLAREIETGRVFIQHRANPPAGGRISEIALIDFLSRNMGSPEQMELSRLIGTLVEGREVPDAPFE